MRRLAVLAERLAVVGEVDDQRVATEAERIERVQQPRCLRVGVHDLSGVGAGRLAAVLLRWRVGLVRVVEVHPQIERALGALRLPQPRQRGIHDGARGTFDVGQRAALEPCVVERIVVGLVTLTDAPP